MTTNRMDLIGQAFLQIVDSKISLRLISIPPMMLTPDTTNQRIFTLKFTPIRKTKRSLGLETPRRSLLTTALICSHLKLVQPFLDPTLNGTPPNSISMLVLSILSTTEGMTSKCTQSILLKTLLTDSDMLQ